jgi:hypothetical protein
MVTAEPPSAGAGALERAVPLLDVPVLVDALGFSVERGVVGGAAVVRPRALAAGVSQSLPSLSLSLSLALALSSRSGGVSPVQPPGEIRAFFKI